MKGWMGRRARGTPKIPSYPGENIQIATLSYVKRNSLEPFDRHSIGIDIQIYLTQVGYTVHAFLSSSSVSLSLSSSRHSFPPGNRTIRKTVAQKKFASFFHSLQTHYVYFSTPFFFITSFFLICTFSYVERMLHAAAAPVSAFIYRLRPFSVTIREYIFLPIDSTLRAMFPAVSIHHDRSAPPSLTLSIFAFVPRVDTNKKSRVVYHIYSTIHMF